jgi:hypothetical protein
MVGVFTCVFCYLRLAVGETNDTTQTTNARAHVLVQDTGRYVLPLPYKTTDETFVQGEIEIHLSKIGIHPYGPEAEADLIVSCHYRHTWMKPTMTRGFKVKARDIGEMNLVISNRHSGAVLMDAKYDKRRDKIDAAKFMEATLSEWDPTKTNAEQSAPLVRETRGGSRAGEP